MQYAILWQEIRYHAICRTELQNRAELKSSTKIKNDWHKTRVAHAVAFEEIHIDMRECVIENDEAHFKKNLVSNYRSILVDVGGPSFQDVVFTSQHLQEKLRLSFGDSILFDHGNKRKGNIVYNANTNLVIAVRKAFESDSKINMKSREMALDLRKSILDCDKRQLHRAITLPDIYQGESDIPLELTEFLSNLIMGNDNRKTNSAIKKRRIESIAHNIIYSATGGSIKPSKQLLSGLAVKSMTGSRRLIEILNRLGQSITTTQLKNWRQN